MAPEELAEIKERADKATPGPWSRNAANVNTKWNERITSTWTFPPNAEFIAHAREDIPKLLAEVERLNRIIELTDKISDAWKHSEIALSTENARMREALSRIKTAAEIKGGTLMKAGVLKLASEALGEGQEK